MSPRPGPQDSSALTDELLTSVLTHVEHNEERLLAWGLPDVACDQQELEEIVKKLQKQNEKLILTNEKQKALLEKLSPSAVRGEEGVTEQREKSLRNVSHSR